MTDVLRKVEKAGRTLIEYAGCKPLFGIKTGFNEAFLIDTATRDALVKRHPECSSLIKPYLRGRDIRRWHPVWENLWIILLKSSANSRWPWSDATSAEMAETVFKKSYPSLWYHMCQHRERLSARADKGEYWWELRSCAYYDVYDNRNIMWQDLSYHSRFCLSPAGYVAEATVFALPTCDPWLLAIFNSSLLWSWMWRNTIHGKDEALRLKTIYTEHIPVAEPSDRMRETADRIAQRLIQLTKGEHDSSQELTRLLKHEYGLSVTLGRKLEAPVELAWKPFLSEVNARRGRKRPLATEAVRRLRQEYGRLIEPVRQLRPEMIRLEYELNGVVYDCYGLTDDERRVLAEYQPLRDPIDVLKAQEILVPSKGR